MNRLIVFTLALLVLGCSQPSKTFYVLTPAGPMPTGGGIAIGVGPVSVAEYLNRPNLVSQQGPNQLAVSEDHRWAGDLSASIARVTATNLGRQMKSGNIRTYPWLRDDEIRYQVTLDIRQLHSEADGYAVIEAGWRAYSLPERTLKASKTFVDREVLATDGYAPMVAAQSKLLERLAENIAAGLR
jgi:uncharacterized lipoprotein YmbA